MFVVQRRVETSRPRKTLYTPTGSTVADLIVDYSAFCSVGIPGAHHWRGVCRAAPSHVVNIMIGGGVVPLLNRSRCKLPPGRARLTGRRRVLNVRTSESLSLTLVNCSSRCYS